MFIVILLLLLIVITRKKTSMTPPSKEFTKPLDKSKAKDIFSTAEKTSLYFDTRIESLIKEKYGKEICSWTYSSAVPTLHYRNKENEVTVFLKDGTEKKEVFFTENVWGKRPISDEQIIVIEEPELSNAQKWMIKHAGMIDEIVQENLKNGQVETDFLHGIEDKILVKEIIKLISENTPYTVAFNGKFIKLNAQALCNDVPEE